MPTTAALRTEIDTDPKTLGFAGLRTQSNAPEALAARLNELGASGETLFRSYLPMEDALAAIVAAEFTTLTAAQKTACDQFLRGNRIRTGDANMRSTLGGLFGVGTTSRTNLLALAQRPCSRAEALWGEGTLITDQQASEAMQTA